MIERLRGDCHLAAGTVEVQGEALAVVEEEERTAGRCSLMDRTHAKLMLYAISGAHEFCIFLV